MNSSAIKRCIKRYSPFVLSCLASVGVVATTVMAVKATPRATELIAADSREKHDGDPYAYTKKEAVMAAWKCYIPAAAFGVSTIVCIMGANALNQRQWMAMASAYALAQQSYKEYTSKVKDIYGKEAHDTIKEAIVKEKCEDVCISSPGFMAATSLDFDGSASQDVVRTFYDSFSQRYFESTIAKVIEAEYHLNRNFMFAGVISLNEFYEFLGLKKTDFGETVGWSSVNGDIYWIDFNHHKVALDSGMEVFVIDMVFEPTAEWMEDL